MAVFPPFLSHNRKWKEVLNNSHLQTWREEGVVAVPIVVAHVVFVVDVVVIIFVVVVVVVAIRPS